MLGVASGQTLGFLLRDFRVPSCGVQVVTPYRCNRQADIRDSTSSHGSLLEVGLDWAGRVGILELYLDCCLALENFEAWKVQ